MRTEVSRIQRRLGTTMVYVTHDQTEAMTLGDRVAVMRLGILQQVASPQELYDSPANLFVAGFIGSPAMNFMGGTLEEGRLRTALGEIPLTGQLRQTLERSGVGREVIVGIRPEDFEDASMVPADVRGNGITLNATIDVIESLGAEKYVYFTRDLGQAVNVAELEELAKDSGRADIGSTAETVVARLNPETRITEGQNAELWVDVRRLHVFDPATGRNLTRGTSGAAGDSAAPAGPGVSAQATTATQTATGDGTTAAADARNADTAAAGAAAAGTATAAAATSGAGTAATNAREAATSEAGTAAADAREAGTAAADSGEAETR
jgi:hypothetical protein